MTPQRTLKGRTKSKSKTFAKGSNFVDVQVWFDECTSDVIISGLPANMITTSKYIITVTKVIEDDGKDNANA